MRRRPDSKSINSGSEEQHLGHSKDSTRWQIGTRPNSPGGSFNGSPFFRTDSSFVDFLFAGSSMAPSRFLGADYPFRVNYLSPSLCDPRLFGTFQQRQHNPKRGHGAPFSQYWIIRRRWHLARYFLVTPHLQLHQTKENTLLFYLLHDEPQL